MPRLSTGLIIVGAYATKVRRALFALLSDRAKGDKEWSRRIAYSSAQLNRVLFELLVRKLKLDKGDVVRVRIEFDVDENSKEIRWKWNTLAVEAFRRVSQEDLNAALRDTISTAEQLAAIPRYSLVKLGSTIDGDVLYSLSLNGEDVGAIIVTPLEGGVLIKGGAVLSPTPATIKRSQLKLRGRTPEDAIMDALPGLLQEEQDQERASKIINELRSRLSPEITSSGKS